MWFPRPEKVEQPLVNRSCRFKSCRKTKSPQQGNVVLLSSGKWKVLWLERMFVCVQQICVHEGDDKMNHLDLCFKHSYTLYPFLSPHTHTPLLSSPLHVHTPTTVSCDSLLYSWRLNLKQCHSYWKDILRNLRYWLRALSNQTSEAGLPVTWNTNIWPVRG